MGSIIFNLAELHLSGRYEPLFDAIDELSHFLSDRLSEENVNYAEETASWSSNIARL